MDVKGILKLAKEFVIVQTSEPALYAGRLISKGDDTVELANCRNLTLAAKSNTISELSVGRLGKTPKEYFNFGENEGTRKIANVVEMASLDLGHLVMEHSKLVKKFNIRDFAKGRIVVCCKTEEAAIDFCNYLHNIDWEWSTNQPLNEDAKWEIYKEHTYYKPHPNERYGLMFGDYRDHAITADEIVVDWNLYM